MLPFFDLDTDDLVALLQHKIQFCGTAALPVVEVIALGGQLLGHIVLGKCPHKGIPLAGEDRLLGDAGFHRQQSHVAHVELEGREIGIDSDGFKGLVDALAF